jgi:conjugal transfer pilus assembly protein TraB
MFRVQTPAILPNHIRKNLRGCFVIAEGKGDLASERIKTRLITLSCISRNGERIIDQKISGFAVDADGQVDIHGRVVSKMGSALARVALAGFLGGVGEAVSSAQGTLNYTDSGVVKDFGQGTDTYIKAGIGKGLQTSLEKLQDFYLKLASQTLPVVETGPSKQVHLVISEGIRLKMFETGQDDFQTGGS